jgi:hypothetical protein
MLELRLGLSALKYLRDTAAYVSLSSHGCSDFGPVAQLVRARA